MKRRFFSIITALALCLGMLPGTAWAEGEAEAGSVIISENGVINLSNVNESTCYKTTTGGTISYMPAEAEGGTATLKVEGKNTVGQIISSCPTIDINLTENSTLNALVVTTESKVPVITVYGTAAWDTSLAPIGENTKLNIPGGTTLVIWDFDSFENEGTIENNGTIQLQGDTAKTDITEVFEKLGSLTGEGIVKLNNGVLVVKGDLTFEKDTSKGGTGYTWDGSTLTLTDIAIDGTVTLPTGCKVTVVTEGNCSIQELKFSNNSGVGITFSGEGELTINSGIQGGAAGDSLTVASGATVIFKGGISLGEAAMNGTVTVNGTLTIENKNETGHAIYTGNVIVNSGGELNVSAATGVQLGGMKKTNDSLTDFNGAFTLKTNGTFTANCTENAIEVFDTVANGPNPFEENLVPKKVIVIPAGYLPDDEHQVSINGDRTKIFIPGGQFTIKKPTVSGSSVNSGPTTYPVYTEPTENGAVTVSTKSAVPGTTVTVTVTPEQGHELDGLTVTDSSGNEVKLTNKGGGRYTFTMPARAVTVTSAFAVRNACGGGADCPSRAFRDLDTSKWYHAATDYVLQNGLMAGYGGGRFGPDDNLSRAQFVQILYNKEGHPAAAGDNPFADVADGLWYTPAVTWAAANGIVSGYGNGQFGPNDPITREQLAVMLWRYAGSPTAANKNLPFRDADAVSGYALEAMRWAVENGILSGFGNDRLGPNGPATRVQAAQMLKNYRKL